MKNFSKKLRQELKRSGIMQIDFSKLIGVSTSQGNFLVTGKRTPSISMALKIEKILNLPHGYLIYDEIAPLDDSVRAPLLKNKKEVDNFILNGNIPQDVEYIQIFKFNKEEFMEKNIYAFMAIGDAMVSNSDSRNSIHHGDQLIIDKSIHPKSGSIVVFTDDGNVKVRKFMQDGTDTFLQALNHSLPLIPITDKIKLAGVVKQINRIL